AVPSRRSLLIGRYVMATAEHREPCDSRGSCTVLGAPGGETPPGDSSTAPQRIGAGERHMSGPPRKMGNRPASLWIAERFGVLRFRLMVKRGPHMRPQASEGEAQHGLFCGTRRIGQGDERLHCGGSGQ